MTVAEVEQQMGSAEVAEWIAELGVLRPEDERAAIERARAEAEGRPYAEPPGVLAEATATQGREGVSAFGAEGPPGFWTAEERERQKRGPTALELAQFDSLVRGPQAVAPSETAEVGQ